MKTSSLFSIFFLILLSCIGCKKENKLEASYKKSVAWLWEQQSEDGGWHSNTHTILQDGRVLTPYILFYLLQVPDSIYPKNNDAIQRGLVFIEHDLWSNDSLSPNYPNYSAAYALQVMVLTQRNVSGQWEIVDYLRRQQFIEHRGTPTESMAYGGWGYGEPDLKPGDFGHVDISHTRRILQALQSYKLNLEEQLKAAEQNGIELKRQPDFDDTGLRNSAMQFLNSVQRTKSDARLYEGCTDRTKIPYDGGFVSSMYTLSTNKCQPYNVNDCYHYPSYATATCDGFLALHSLGLQKTSAYSDAKQWLTDHQQIDVIDGLSKDDPEQWYLIMHYYHWSVRAEAMKAAGIDGPWKENLRKALIDEQLENGSYINPLGGVNKEDDPLMATVFCVQAFTNVVNQ